MELKAGEMSLHHGSLFHAPGANRTSTRRIGLALRFVTPEMKQVVGAVDYATLVRGEGRFGHFRPEPEKLGVIDGMLRDRNAYLYAGAEERAPDVGSRQSRQTESAVQLPPG